MANHILFGGQYIPILYRMEFQGQHPSANPTFNIPGTNEEHFNGGVVVGGANPKSNWRPEPWTNIIAGVTDIHDSATIVNATPTQPNGVESYWVTDVVIRRGDQILFNDTFNVSAQWAGPAQRRMFLALYAVEWHYPNAATPNAQVSCYTIAGVIQTESLNSSGEVISTSYSTHNESLIIPIAYLNEFYNLNMYYEGEDPEVDPFDPSNPEPYNPDKDDTSDTIGLPSDPPIGITGAGFINIYKPGIGSLRGLGDILFPNVATATDVMDAILKLCETIANQNLINYVIDCHVIPISPVTGTSQSIKIGFRDTGIVVPVVTSDYVNFSCGSLNIREYFGGFSDYASGTRSKIFLPFLGFVDTKPEYWQSGTISIDYKFNIIDGSFMVYIRSASSKSQLNGSVIAQYAGNACMHFPITGVNYASMVSGLVGAAIASAGKSGGVSPALGAAYSAANTLAQGGDVQQSNGYNSTAAMLTVRTPFLLIERVAPSYSGGYAHDNGYPANIYTQLSNVSGYTEVSDIDLTGLPFTADELNELRQLLADGVYF